MITIQDCAGHTSRGKCKVMNGTHYHHETPFKLVNQLEMLRMGNIRVKIAYGDPATKEAWGDVETGYISRSTGTCKIPICCYNSRSRGGGGLLDNRIISISHSKGGREIYHI